MLPDAAVTTKHNKNMRATDEDFCRIHELVRIITENEITEICFEKEDYKLTIKRNTATATVPPLQQAPVSVPAVAPATPSPAPAETASPPSPTASQDHLISIKSPIVGTFYRKAAPDKPNYVNEGDSIKKGSILCIVEAMKLFNEIESEVEGKIVKILVEDAQPVEFDQPLFLVDPR